MSATSPPAASPRASEPARGSCRAATTGALRLPRRRLLALAGAAVAGAALAGCTRPAPAASGPISTSAPARAGVPASTVPPGSATSVASPSPGTAAPAEVRLANGLRVIVESRSSADVVALQGTALAGGRDDGVHPGLSTMTSRSMFSGTPGRPSDPDLRRVAARVGGTVTWNTFPEYSDFACVVPADAAEVAFDLVGDILAHPLFDLGTLQGNKELTLQDLARRQADPSTLLYDTFQSAMFAGSPLGTPIVGTADSVSRLTRDVLLGYHQQFWSGANLVLTVVGRIASPAATDLATKYFGGLPAGAANARVPAAPARREVGQTVHKSVGQQQAQFRLGYAAPGLRDADRFPLQVLDALTSGGSGRLFRALRTTRGLSYSAGSGYVAFSDAGAWYATAGVDPQNVGAAVDVVKTELQTLGAAPAARDEVADASGSFAGQQIVAGETDAARAGQLGIRATLDEPPLEEFLARIRAVTPADVQRVARTYLDGSRALLAVVGPGNG